MHNRVGSRVGSHASRSGRRWPIALSASALASPLLACVPFTTFTVTTTLDAVDAAPGDGRCETTKPGQCTLRAAIQEANASGGPVTIVLFANTFTLAVTGADEDAGATGDLDTAGVITIEGHGATLHGNSADRVLDHHSGTLRLSDLTVTRGIVPSGGGGLRLGADATLSGITITDNTATAATGSEGIAIAQTGGAVTIANSSIVGNSEQTTQSGTAGVIRLTGGSLVITDTDIRGNSSWAHTEGGVAGGSWFVLTNGRHAGVIGDPGTHTTLINTRITENFRSFSGQSCNPFRCIPTAGANFAGGAIGGTVEVSFSFLSDPGAEVLPSLDTGTASVSASVIAACGSGVAVTSLGYNRVGPGCPVTGTDGAVAGATVDQIPVGTAELCDGTSLRDHDRLGVARPRGAACDIGDLES